MSIFNIGKEMTTNAYVGLNGDDHVAIDIRGNADARVLGRCTSCIIIRVTLPADITKV